MILANMTPAAVAMQNAQQPMTRMPSVWRLRNCSAESLEPTAMPRKIVTMLMRAFWAVSDRRSTTPHSRIRLPSMSMPISGAASGSRNAQRSVMRTGKQIFSIFGTTRSCFMRILRSASVVQSFMIGGWMIGTRAM